MCRKKKRKLTLKYKGDISIFNTSQLNSKRLEWFEYRHHLNCFLLQIERLLDKKTDGQYWGEYSHNPICNEKKSDFCEIHEDEKYEQKNNSQQDNKNYLSVSFKIFTEKKNSKKTGRIFDIDEYTRNHFIETAKKFLENTSQNQDNVIYLNILLIIMDIVVSLQTSLGNKIKHQIIKKIATSNNKLALKILRETIKKNQNANAEILMHYLINDLTNPNLEKIKKENIIAVLESGFILLHDKLDSKVLFEHLHEHADQDPEFFWAVLKTTRAYMKNNKKTYSLPSHISHKKQSNIKKHILKNECIFNVSNMIADETFNEFDKLLKRKNIYQKLKTSATIESIIKDPNTINQSDLGISFYNEDRLRVRHCIKQILINRLKKIYESKTYLKKKLFNFLGSIENLPMAKQLRYLKVAETLHENLDETILGNDLSISRKLDFNVENQRDSEDSGNSDISEADIKITSEDDKTNSASENNPSSLKKNTSLKSQNSSKEQAQTYLQNENKLTTKTQKNIELGLGIGAFIIGLPTYTIPATIITSFCYGFSWLFTKAAQSILPCCKYTLNLVTPKKFLCNTFFRKTSQYNSLQNITKLLGNDYAQSENDCDDTIDSLKLSPISKKYFKNDGIV